MIAIYEIRNTITGRVYVGGSFSVRNRWSVHKYHLKLGKHASKAMQDDYNEYGLESFEHKVLEELAAETTKEQLLEREQYYLDTLQPFGKSGYNFNPIAGSRKGTRHTEESRKKISESRKGIPHTEEHKKKIGAANKGRTHSEEAKKKMSEGRKGKKLSEVTKKKISGENAHAAKLTWEKVREIRKLYAAGGIYQKKIASLFSVSEATINNIVNNRTWIEK